VNADRLSQQPVPWRLEAILPDFGGAEGWDEACWTNDPPIHGRVIRAIEIWHVVYTRTQEHVETVERTQLEAADRK
jgi:hypothetical protein